MLLGHMQENPGIAQNFSKEPKEKVAAFWKRVETNLNSAGPPIKSVAEWKKVWMDQKRYVRKKATANFQNLRETGGGPNKELKLSPMEESIFQLMGTKEAVEGIESGQRFGISLPTENNISNRDEMSEIEEYVSLSAENAQVDHSKENRKRPSTPVTEMTFEAANPRKKPKQKIVGELVEKELEVQKKLCEKISDAVDHFKEQNVQMQTNLKKIYRSLDRLHEDKKLQLKEMKRHNFEMEKLRKDEVDSKLQKNRLLIEIEDIKLRLLKKTENM